MTPTSLVLWCAFIFLNIVIIVYNHWGDYLKDIEPYEDIEEKDKNP